MRTTTIPTTQLHPIYTRAWTLLTPSIFRYDYSLISRYNLIYNISLKSYTCFPECILSYPRKYCIYAIQYVTEIALRLYSLKSLPFRESGELQDRRKLFSWQDNCFFSDAGFFVMGFYFFC